MKLYNTICSIIYLKMFEILAGFNKSTRQAQHINSIDYCKKSARISKDINFIGLYFQAECYMKCCFKVKNMKPRF